MGRPINILRREAKEKGLIHYFTGKPCAKGHVCFRYTANGACVECAAEQSKNWRNSNPEQYVAMRRNWQAENIDYIKAKNRARTECRAQKRSLNRSENSDQAVK